MKLSWKKIPKKYHHFIGEIHNSGCEVSIDIKKGYAGEDGLHEWVMDSWCWSDMTQKEIYEDLNNFLSTVKIEGDDI